MCFDDTLNEDTQDFLIRMLHPDPKQRLCSNGVDGIKNHAYFNNINWDVIDSGKSVAPSIPAISPEAVEGNYESHGHVGFRGLETLPSGLSGSNINTNDSNSNKSMAIYSYNTSNSNKTLDYNNSNTNPNQSYSSAKYDSKKNLSESVACDINTALQRYGSGNWLREQVSVKLNTVYNDWSHVNRKLIREEIFAANHSKSMSEVSTLMNNTINSSLKSLL